jgi:hypothetical protein
MPWAFYMGGQFHIIPQWIGWGRMHSNFAGDYILYVQLSPARPSKYAQRSAYQRPRISLYASR